MPSVKFGYGQLKKKHEFPTTQIEIMTIRTSFLHCSRTGHQKTELKM
jgi:hypothetical protein